MNQKIKNKLSRDFKGLVNWGIVAAILLLSYSLLRVVLEPAPYSYTNLRHKENISVCVGETFEYYVDVEVNKTPITIEKTETFYSATPEVNKYFFAKKENVRIFNWDNDVLRKFTIHSVVQVPEKTPLGIPTGSGDYRYIVNLQSMGYKHVTSISIPVHVNDCTKK